MEKSSSSAMLKVKKKKINVREANYDIAGLSCAGSNVAKSSKMRQSHKGISRCISATLAVCVPKDFAPWKSYNAELHNYQYIA